jgi:hypothetical protein
MFTFFAPKSLPLFGAPELHKAGQYPGLHLDGQAQEYLAKERLAGVSHSFHRIKLSSDRLQSIAADNPPLDESKKLIDSLLAFRTRLL